MRFGLQFFPAVGPADKAPAQYYEECLKIAEEAESLGFSHVRVVEHYFEPYGGYSPNPIVLLSALSQRTKTMRLITGAVLPVFNHPLKLAGELAMLDGLSGGRLEIGFARAFLLHEFRRFGISPDESRARFEEGLAQIELLLTHENVSHEGRFHRFHDVTSLPRPTQRPRPNFFIAANQTEETFAFAGRHGHSVMAIPWGAKLRPLIDAYRAAWREAGHPGQGEVMLASFMFAHEDGAQAREIARGPMMDYFRKFAEATVDWEDGAKSKDYPGYAEAMARIGDITLEDQIAGGGAFVGSPAEIRDIAMGLREAIGPYEITSLQVNFGTLAYQDAQRSLRLFAAEVLPGLATA